MSRSAKILAFAGSARRESYNKKLIQVAAEGAREAGAAVTLIDLADYPLPFFNEDLESSQEPAREHQELHELFREHDGFLISAPEYNSSITPLLKNTIDWVSRPLGDWPGGVAYKGKAAALMATSPGALGGLRGLVHVRAILQNIGVLVLPAQVAVPKAGGAFDEHGSLTDDRVRARIHDLGKSLTDLVTRLNDR